MWIAKFRIKHDCILGNRCRQFNITLQSIAFSTFKDKNKIVSSSMHYMSGSPENINKFISDLKKDKKVISVEQEGDMFFLLEKSDDKAVSAYNPKIIFSKPVFMDNKGFETWEISSWKREEIEKFINATKKKMTDFKLLNFSKISLNSIFFPKLMPKLTQKQKRAFDLALNKGYFSTPRKTDMRALAKIMGVSLATYQQHLRAAQEKMMPAISSYSN